MSQCLKRVLPRCSKALARYEGGRQLSDKRFTKAGAASQPLLDLEAVHKEWKSGGFFPRAPPHVVKHGAKCLQTQLSHARLTEHVFGGTQYRMFPLSAQFGERSLDLGTLVSSSHTAAPPQVDWSALPIQPDKKYSLILYSPDCSSCKLHWWVSNISPGDVTTQSDDVTTQSDDVATQSDDVTVLPYIPALPLKGTGFYRYVLVLLEQDSHITAPTDTDRLSELSGVISEHELLPVGLALYQAFWDESVGPNLAGHLGLDEKQFSAERPKDIDEFYAEERFLRKEWEMKTGFM